MYEEIVLDMKRANRYRQIMIPPEGLVLEPNKMYLGRTIEYTQTRNLVHAGRTIVDWSSGDVRTHHRWFR